MDSKKIGYLAFDKSSRSSTERSTKAHAEVLRNVRSLTEQTGIELSSSQVTNIKKKYVYIWAKYSLEERQDPKKRKEFKQKLAEYLKIAKEEPDKLQVWFWYGASRWRTCVATQPLTNYCH